MVINLSPELEAALTELARKKGILPEELATDVLRDQILSLWVPPVPSRSIEMPIPRDEWERQLLAISTDCGVSLGDENLSREELYE